MKDFWFKCPDCQLLGFVDEDQAYGRVSIQCECGFHKTGRISPIIEGMILVNRDKFRSFIHPSL